MALLEIRDLHLSMNSFEGEAQVLNGVDLAVERGEIWGVVGETGCGKSLTGLSISRLVPEPPARYARGKILFDGRDVLAASEEDMRKLRGRRIGMIFQDPTTNLNPVFRIGDQMIDVALHAAELEPDLLGGPRASRRERRAAARKLAIELLDSVGIPDAGDRLDSYPHQFSGGMRQRVLIAMALIGRPDLLIADEPTTALDVSVQAQVLRILYDLVRKHDLAVLLITHNLGVVAQLCSHVAVMYAGNIVEAGRVDAVLSSPRHPYTRALLAAVPGTNAERGALAALGGSVPNLLNPPPGCRFAPRCRHAMPRCSAGFPPMIDIDIDQRVACVLYDEKTRAA
jgi:peptide/nickel transport system ATP-binding protein